MNIINIILAAGTGAALAATLIISINLYRRRTIRPRVLAVLKSGETVRGALIAKRIRHIELGGAELLEQGKATPIDGVAYIDRDNIVWMQEPPT